MPEHLSWNKNSMFQERNKRIRTGRNVDILRKRVKFLI